MNNIIIDKIEKESDVILNLLKDELNGIRSSRPHPGLVENIKVDYLGSVLPIRQLASIQISPPSSLLVQPWDKESLAVCEKAIVDADLGVSVSQEGDHLRVVLPTLSAERREEMIKLANKKGEDSKIRIRQERDNARKSIQKDFDGKEISEDDKFRLQDEVQKVVDGFNKKVEELLKDKEAELKS